MSKVGLLAGLCLLACSAAGQAEWRKYDTPHFVIYSESPRPDVETLGSRLEKIDGLMRLATALKDDVAPVKVRVYQVVDNIKVADAMGVDADTGIAGFYTNSGLGPYLVTPRKTTFNDVNFTPELVLHHEYAHHFMLQYFPAEYPFWYVEGFAELIGSSKIRPDGQVAYGMPAKHRGNEILADWVSMRETLLTRPEKIVYFDTYGQGWAMTHFLTFTKDRAAQFRRYLADLQSGKRSAEAAAEFGDLDKLNSDARRYVGAGDFAYKLVSVKVREPVIQSVSAISAGEAAMVPETIAFSDFDLDGLRKPGARARQAKRRSQILERVRTKAASYAGDPYAQRLLSEVEAAQGNWSQSEAAADRLLAIAPNDLYGLARKSIALSHRAAGLGGTARVDLAAQARHLAVKANRIDSSEPLPIVAYYESYHSIGERAPDLAIDGLAQVLSVRPADDKTRNLLVDALADRGRYDEAIVTLLPIVRQAEETPQRTAARAKLEKLKAEAAARKPAAAKAS